MGITAATSNMKSFIFLLSLNCLLVLIQSSESEKHEVIIVGGGAAGIAAATRLDAKGVDFILLEAESQIGGRVKSVHFGESKVDLGAQWVHGEKNNFVYETMKDTGMLHHAKRRYKLYFSDREDISEEFSAELLDIFLEVYDSATEENSNADDTAGDYFIRSYTKIVNKKFANNKEKIKVAMQVLPLMETYICSLEASFNWQLPSALTNSETCEGDQTITWDGKGYFSALEYLMIGFNSTGKVFTDKVVTKIESKQDGVVVRGDGFAYTASYVIFTPSLGVLKNHHRDLFDPPLSESKTKAIETLGFDAVHKVWLHFPEQWWNESLSDFNLAWTWEDLFTMKTQYPKGPHHDGKTFLTNLNGLLGTPKNPKVLSAWFVGEFVPEIEKMEDDDLIDGIMFALEKFVGHLYKVQRPDILLRGKWYSNKHFHGTYSYQTVASRRMPQPANKILAEPIKTSDNVNRLLFAGEATNLKHYSTVHGAIETGHREADRVIEAVAANKI